MTLKILKFPTGFLWGAATSAYQIEGGLVNDWSEWEKSPKRVKKLKAQGLNPADFQSGLAADSWNRFEEDLACLKKINASAYRFSIDWSRVEPEEARFDEGTLNHYSTMVARLREENIEPFVTIWHWPIPLWLRDKGGFEAKKIIFYFTRFAERVALALPTVKFWLTINEPTVYTGDSYFRGIWPTQKRNIFAYLKVLNNLAKVHKATYALLKKINPDCQVGIASSHMYFEAGPGIINKFAKTCADWWQNNHFLDQIKEQQDFIGLNFYLHVLLNYGFKDKNKKTSDLGWELSPSAIYNMVMYLNERYHKPIYITENGLADAKDTYRTWYIEEALIGLHKAISEGADVRGYLHWSLIDNFEWTHGYSGKFGLFSVDRKTFIRTPRPSALVYAEICKNNELKIEN
jgi:beta-glucosidase